MLGVAVVNYPMAKRFGKPMALLPSIVVARFAQGYAIGPNSARSGAARPRGEGVGIRSFTMMTGARLAASSPMIAASIPI